MRKRWVTLLTWALIAALPVQGIAAVSMVHCRNLQSASAGHDDSTSHHHVAEVSDHVHTGVFGSHHQAHSDDADDAGVNLAAKNSCSVCAACCVGLALPVAVWQQSDPPPSLQPLVRAESLTAGLTGHALFRPPR